MSADKIFIHRNGHANTDPFCGIDEDGNVMGLAYDMQTCILEAAACFHYHRKRRATIVLMTDATKGKNAALFEAALSKTDGLIERGEDCTLMNLYREANL